MICGVKEKRPVLGKTVFIWIFSKLEMILFPTWTTPCRIVRLYPQRVEESFSIHDSLSFVQF